MPEDTYRLNERLRLIGKRLDHRYPMPDMPARIIELLSRLAEIEVPKKNS
jgi:hypothetical protein